MSDIVINNNHCSQVLPLRQLDQSDVHGSGVCQNKCFYRFRGSKQCIKPNFTAIYQPDELRFLCEGLHAKDQWQYTVLDKIMAMCMQEHNADLMINTKITNYR
jgi:hypothetical protein